MIFLLQNYAPMASPISSDPRHRTKSDVNSTPHLREQGYEATITAKQVSRPAQGTPAEIRQALRPFQHVKDPEYIKAIKNTLVTPTITGRG